MFESNLQEEPSLAAVAFLYASGELSGEDAAVFEQRLGEEQAARDALCHAVTLSQALEGQPAPMPSLAYRDKVRRRLRSSLVSHWLPSRAYRGHPALWTVLGMAAALLLMQLGPPAQPPASQAPAPQSASSQPEPAAPDEEAETARRWANLHNNEHLSRARLEEFRRRLRADDRRLVRGDERLRSFLGSEPKQ